MEVFATGSGKPKRLWESSLGASRAAIQELLDESHHFNARISGDAAAPLDRPWCSMRRGL